MDREIVCPARIGKALMEKIRQAVKAGQDITVTARKCRVSESTVRRIRERTAPNELPEQELKERLFRFPPGVGRGSKNRCPTCGGMVYGQCLACWTKTRITAWKAGVVFGDEDQLWYTESEFYQEEVVK